MRPATERQPMNRPAFPHERDLLMVDAWAGICCLVTEQASANEWRDAADAFNVVEMLLTMGKLPEHVRPVVACADEALKRAADAISGRRAQHLSHDEKVALVAIGDTYYGALRRLSRGTVHDAIQKVIAKTNAVRARYISGVNVIDARKRAEQATRRVVCVAVD